MPNVNVHYLPDPPTFPVLLPFVFTAPIKVLQQIVWTLFVLFIRIWEPPEFILVQNPPTIPTLLIAQLAGHLRGCKVIIDWHNLGFSVLALKIGDDHLFVKIAARLEKLLGRSAYAHLFVTKAMRNFLVEKWDLQGYKVVFHDRPPRHFHRATDEEIHNLFLKYQSDLGLQPLLEGFLPDYSPPISTAFSRILCNEHKNTACTCADAYTGLLTLSPSPVDKFRRPILRPDRPALLVSSTSWTADEDFGLLLQALQLYEARAEELANQNVRNEILPKLLVIITGKGPLRDHYMMQVKRLHENWKWVRCISLWLRAEDYPILLGSADLGVCMHSSTSALDLPMKVVDMFGCQLPVCALDFGCLHELVKDNINGLVFKDSRTLAKHLEDLFIGFPRSHRLSELRNSLIRTSQSFETSEDNEETTWRCWEDHWEDIVQPLVLCRRSSG